MYLIASCVFFNFPPTTKINTDIPSPPLHDSLPIYDCVEARPSDDPLWNAPLPQGSVSMSLDRFSEQTGIVPHHIKIDVDGIEPLIIAGAAKLLANPKLVSVMVETMEQLESHRPIHQHRSEEHTTELQSLMRISYAVFFLKKKKNNNTTS